ncbi:MAG: cation diffusion facilitator family transporter [Elusimicrobiota bacterium]|nr:MAG: cation diffusion facilitator family transporter [Elusimicrobiota bacterium]
MDPSEDVRLAAISALSNAVNPKAQAALQWALASERRPHMRSSLELALSASKRRHAGLGLHRAPSSEDLVQTQSPLREIALKRALAVSAVFVVVEFVGAWMTGSVALKADAMHLAADQMISAAALISLWVARRPPNSRKSYGYLKVEPVVALIGAGAIALMGFEMGSEAWQRLFNPGAAATWSVALFALSSLAANLVSAALLWRYKDDGLSMKSAFLHAATDAVGSVGVILSAAAAILLGWLWVEPVAVAFILVMLARVAWELGKPAWNTLIDAVPDGVDLDKIEADLLAIPGAASVRDLHVWALNSRMNSLTAIVYIREGADHEAVLATAKAVLKEKHGIGHLTVQVETIKAD